ncbi:MAG: HlyD family efflux transporter periplasmic adaptor subunit, partial [Alphaproteobacteria bacterium]|nr:HlyD family efflux transporter periplasmic adaptor subunit [Alphaproteobacteria bacterium]
MERVDANSGRRTLKRGAVALAVVAAAGLLAYGYYRTEADDSPINQYRTMAVSRGPIVSAVSATGTLAAVVTVEVSSQISGQIRQIAVDFNSTVKREQVVGQIAPETFEARVREAEGDLAVARADVLVKKAALERARADIENARAGQQASRADIERFRAAADDAKRDFDRKRQLQQSGVMATSQVERAQSVLDQARAQQAGANAQERALGSQVSAKVAALRMAEAEVEHAEAMVGQKSAVLLRNQVDLDRTIIRSPIDGIVIGRSVDVGQTVAASLAAPTLFTIAQDLHDMQVNVNIDEADIGRIRAGQRAMFTVDAFGGREFEGKVQQLRKAPQSVQNVVTYTVVVTAENPDLILLPGMTANVKIVVDEKRDVLRVPNGALRFRPPGIEPGATTGSAS